MISNLTHKRFDARQHFFSRKNIPKKALYCLFFAFILTAIVFASMAGAVKRAAGLLVFRVVEGPAIEYLLLQASYGSRHWTPPKGHAEKGESLLDTALRETEEETHFNRNQLFVLDKPPIQANYLVKSKPKEVSYFLAELVKKDQPVILSKEHQAYKWCDFGTAFTLVEYEEMKNVFKHAKEILSQFIKAGQK